MYVADDRRALSYRQSVVQSRSPQVACIFGRRSVVALRTVEYLEQEGYQVRTLTISSDAVQRVKQISPALIILEAETISRQAALDLCRAIRRVPSLNWTPIVLLSPHTSEDERVLGLESGADEYITESSSGTEVAARVRAVMRRFMRYEVHPGAFSKDNPSLQYSWSAPNTRIIAGDIEIDPTAMTIAVRGTPVETTNLEFRLLYYLLHHQGRVFTRDELLNAVWGAEFVELRSVDACIRRLRRKIEPEPYSPTYLKTVRGAGYCFQRSVA